MNLISVRQGVRHKTMVPNMVSFAARPPLIPPGTHLAILADKLILSPVPRILEGSVLLLPQQNHPGSPSQILRLCRKLQKGK